MPFYARLSDGWTPDARRRHTHAMSRDPSPTRTRLVVISVVAATVATGLIYVLLRFVFHKHWTGRDIVILFLAILVPYLIGPFRRRIFRGPARK
jgi:hypothetical protein